MSKLEAVFVPFSAGHPALLTVNGHRLLLVATEADDLNGQLGLFDAEELREVHIDEAIEDTLAQLGGDGQAGVVVVPPGASAFDVIESLHSELPWVH
ncbi:MAG: hypothetical protein KDD66_16600 [Bdellovibrionales bacterium]|nr:hypothetical protein [Bdellovibrionales bacterium]